MANDMTETIDSICRVLAFIQIQDSMFRQCRIVLS